MELAIVMVRVVSFTSMFFLFLLGIVVSADSAELTAIVDADAVYVDESGEFGDEPELPTEENTISENTVPIVEDEIVESEIPSLAERSPWDSFYPPMDENFDWVQLTSGEWLKGEMKVYYNFILEFDSEEMDLQSFDWEDVRQIRTAGYQLVRVENYEGGREPVTLEGKLLLIGDDAFLFADEEEEQVVEFYRDQIIAIAEKVDERKEVWGGSFSLGSTFRSGNSDTVDGVLAVNLARTTVEDRYATSYRGNFSETENVETANDHRLNAHYDIFKTLLFFLRPVAAEYYRDLLKNVEHQVSLSTALGYHLVHNPKTKWVVAAGVGGLYKSYESVKTDEDSDAYGFSFGLRTEYSTALTSSLDYEFDYKFQIVEKDLGSYIHHLVTSLEKDLVYDLDLEVTFVWDRVEDPQAASDGVVAEKDDYNLVVSFGYDF